MLVKKYWAWCFLIVLAADAIALAIPWFAAHFLLKILLVPLLMVGLLGAKQNSAEKNWRLILAGLVVAWAGDTLLLFSKDMPIFFVLGLSCFLLTHLAYIIYFHRYKKGSNQWFAQHPVVSFLVILYTVFLYAYLFPGLGNLIVPVGVYTLLITMMILQAFSAQPFLPAICNRHFVPGAVLFAASDSMLGVDKFAGSFPFSDSLIIISYGLAQLGIVRGAILNTDKIIESTQD